MKVRSIAKFLLWTTVIVGGTLVVLRVALFQTWTVPNDDPELSASIAPSLAEDDLVIVAHGLPRKFGNLVRCAHPENAERWIIGRIVGEAGDTVEISGARLSVNGRATSSSVACKPATIQVAHPTTGSLVDLRCDVEEIGSISHLRAYGDASRSDNSSTKRTVPPDTYFLVSDNRALAYDSFRFGAVPIEACDARVFFRIWSSEGFWDTDTRFMWVH
ncbi:MAG: signal peptidase I [Polyangiaceae bacterium]|nr:signal peptidase I [Polyangiaceae bacterium]